MVLDSRSDVIGVSQQYYTKLDNSKWMKVMRVICMKFVSQTNDNRYYIGKVLSYTPLSNRQ